MQVESPVAMSGSVLPPVAISPRAGNTSTETLLSVSHLTKSYGSRCAIRGVSFEASCGIIGLLGPNGAGKSTLLRCVAGLAAWDSGEVRIAGIDLAKHTQSARSRIGFMPERVAFPAEMRVKEYLFFVAKVKGIPRAKRRNAVEVVLGQAGLESVCTRIVGNLSKGYRQRVGLGQALLADTSVVVLDEPTAGLDPLTVMELRATLQECAGDRAIIVSTHLLPEARSLCERVLVMSGGQLIYDGPTIGMIAAAAHRLRARIRVQRVGCGERLVSDIAGRAFLDCHGEDGRYTILVDVEGEEALGNLVSEFVKAGWSVVGVEPTTDALEDAFRSAVLDSDAPERAPRSSQRNNQP